ncbi:hypothetical protein AB1Y20_017843 [Prymnesium parvum]|uniref:NB-ARC domain-containing protein n=1 Tax=Prymnesium parvum TaxID=97485 RepID=A0AB34JQA3_PRYPA
MTDGLQVIYEYIEKNNVHDTDANLIICVESLDRDVDAWRVPILMFLALPNRVAIDEGRVHERAPNPRPDPAMPWHSRSACLTDAGTARHNEKRSTAVDVLFFVSTPGEGLLPMAKEETRALYESFASKGRSIRISGREEGMLTDLLATISPRVVVLLGNEEGGHAYMELARVVDFVAHRDATTRPRLVIANFPDSAHLCEHLARAGVHAMGWSTHYEAAAAMRFSVGVVEELLAAEGDACAAPSRPALRLAFAQGRTRLLAAARGGQGSSAFADSAKAAKFLWDGGAEDGIPLLMLAQLSAEQIVGHLPILPKFYVPRPEMHEALRDQLLADGTQAVAITPEVTGSVISSPEKSAVAVGSPAGAGKSTQAVAVAVAHDLVVQTHFDQLVWLVIGEERSGTEVLWELARLTAVPHETLRTIEQATRQGRERTAAELTRDLLTAAIGAQLEGKRTLLVSEDVWKPEQAEAVHHLKAEGGALVRLYTTRNQRIADSYAPQHPPMEGEQAKQLFRSHAGLAKAKQLFRSLVGLANGGCREEPELLRHCSGLRISIIAVATLCRAKGSEWALAHLEKHLSDPLVPGYGTLHVALQGTLLHVAKLYQRLDEQCLMLAVFYADAHVPLTEVGKLWGIAAQEEVKRRVAVLADWNLVAHNHADETLTLIDKHRTAYATLAGEQRMRGWHEALLRACEARVIPAPRGYWSRKEFVEHHLLEWGGKLSKLDGGLGRVEALDLRGCKRLFSLDLPASLTHIGDAAFFDCSGLTSVVLPASLTHIGDALESSNERTQRVQLDADWCVGRA